MNAAQFRLACSTGGEDESWRGARLGAHLSWLSLLPLAGYLADRFGRRGVLCGAAGAGAALGIVASFATTRRQYLALDALQAALGGGSRPAGYAAAIELASDSAHRAAFSCAVGAAEALGEVAGAACGGSWRAAARWTAGAGWIALGAALVLLREGPGWSAATGREEQAARELRRAAALAGVPPHSAPAPSAPEPRLDLRTLVGRSALCGLVWAAAAVAARGAGGVTTARLEATLAGAAETAGALLSGMAAERCGRRAAAAGALLVCGFCTWWAASGGGVAARAAGRVAGRAVRDGVRLLSAELAPVSARCSVLAGCEVAGGAALLVPPDWLGVVGACGAAVAGALLVLLSPAPPP